MKEIRIPGLVTPKLYQATDKNDAKILKDAGIPYVYSPGLTLKEIYAFLFRPWFMKNFPTASFWKRLSMAEPEEVMVHMPYVEGTHNEYDDGAAGPEDIDLRKYMNIKGAEVNIEILMDLGLIPMFLADVETAIKSNLTGFNYKDGYNKKTSLLSGTYTAGYELPNLLIVDVSNSMRAVSGTLIALCHTMAHRLNADVIVTGGLSYFWPLGTLPDAKTIRSMIPEANEGKMFNKILRTELAGKEYGNVVGFGDGDAPNKFCTTSNRMGFVNGDEHEILEIKVGHVYGYHTSYQEIPGYLLWTQHYLPTPPPITLDNSWVNWT